MKKLILATLACVCIASFVDAADGSVTNVNKQTGTYQVGSIKLKKEPETTKFLNSPKPTFPKFK